MALKYINEADLTGKRVLARFDFNVPLKDGEIKDTTRIDMALPTIKMILEKGAKKLILMSHLGRPKGKALPELSLAPVAAKLAEELNTEVFLTERPSGKGIKDFLNLPESKIVLLENIRFHSGEEKNDSKLASELSELADIYVNDSFGTAHRKHASTYAIVSFFKNSSYGGLLIKKEVEAIHKIIEQPKKPFVAIVGGAKVSDKIKTLERLLPHVDNLLIGGAMAYPFLKAKGHEVGTSLCSDDDVKLAKRLLSSISAQKIVLPVDHIVAKAPNEKGKRVDHIPEDMSGFDIGPSSTRKFTDIISQAQTIFWNGPMGFFEEKEYSVGTFDIAKAVASSSAFSLVGGGDSVRAVNESGRASEISHVSTGGGATLEFIEHGQLPCIQALKFGVEL